ncbi:MAG TPA: hypothetical protein QF423_02510 [Candidatus Scalindua sp.]|nr:hypothetical protein [Candidatus Scalindua sp.]
MAKIEVSLPKIADPDDSVLKQVTEEAMAIAKGLPSPHRSSLREELRNRVQMNFPRVPVFVKDQFTAAALAAGMTKVEFFYYCLREGGGLDIPPYDQMDLRKT